MTDKNNTPKEMCIFPDEIEHLHRICVMLDEAIKQASDSVERLDNEYMDTKRYMVQYGGEIDPHEMFQNELALKQIDNRGVFACEVRSKLIKMQDSPYFARMDFQRANMKTPDTIYIGRFSFSHEDELLISDWRSPVASMFYDFEVGPAGYTAPSGRIEGELQRKRQFKIKNGNMEYALESSINIQDDILQRELSSTSDEKMKSIITTIQREQNQVIRNDNSKTLLIQGVAGSGKTSIALHRIAYLLYRFKGRLTSKNIAILSPNKVFGDYISSVLPELGEEPVYEISFKEIAASILHGIIQFEPDKNPLDTEDPLWADRVRFKSTLDFVSLMDDYLTHMAENIFTPCDYSFGRFSVTSNWIKSRFGAYHRYPVKSRLQMICDDIRQHFKTDNFMDEPLPKSSDVLKSLNKMLKFKNTLALYKDFYKKSGISDKFLMPSAKTLEWCDVYPFMYFHASFHGLEENKGIHHLIVDEMQDYTPVQYKVINILYTCQKTILGDFGQFINPNHFNTLKDLRQLYEDAEYVELNKSYRSTYEIITFAGRIQNIPSLEPTPRHGKMPKLILCSTREEELNQICKVLDGFYESKNTTLGIILKTDNIAETYYDALSKDYDLHLISSDSSSFVNGISVTSIQMSKGLEFDQVIIPQVNCETYFTQWDRSLLYIACTRAMHQLSLTYTGELTPLIDAVNCFDRIN